MITLTQSVIALRKLLNKVTMGDLRCSLDVPSSSIGMAVCNVLFNGTAKQYGVLLNHTNARSPGLGDVLSNVVVREKDRAGSGIIESEEKKLN